VSRQVVIAANSASNIVTFRQGLIRALKGAGYDVVVIAPRDPAADARMDRLSLERITVRLDRSGLDPIADLKLLWAYRRILKGLRPAALLRLPNGRRAEITGYANVPLRLQAL